MNFSPITVSFPIDEETYAEIEELCTDASTVDGVSYGFIMQLEAMRKFDVSGFAVLIYDDTENKLAAVASAVDMLGLHTFEWSLVVAPQYRRARLGYNLLQLMHESLRMRNAEGALALTFESNELGATFLRNNGYRYSFSEATLSSDAKELTTPLELDIRPYDNSDKEQLYTVLMSAFGDTYEEAEDLIAYNTAAQNTVLWVASNAQGIVGTVTTRVEGEVVWLTALAVHPNFSGQGFGSALLQWVQHIAAKGGQQVVLLDVEVENERALHIYERANFKKQTQVDYYVFVK